MEMRLSLVEVIAEHEAGLKRLIGMIRATKAKQIYLRKLRPHEIFNVTRNSNYRANLGEFTW